MRLYLVSNPTNDSRRLTCLVNFRWCDEESRRLGMAGGGEDNLNLNGEWLVLCDECLRTGKGGGVFNGVARLIRAAFSRNSLCRGLDARRGD